MLKIITALFILLSLEVEAALVLESQFKVNGTRGGVMQEGQKATWEFSFFNPMMNMNHRMFMPMHAKLMHTVIIGENLSHFAHIHPYFNKASGTFSIDINTVYNDPDNTGTSLVTPYAGKYYMVTEVMPMKQGEEPPMKIDRYEIEVNGSTPQPAAPTEYDDARTAITRYFDKDSSPSEDGAHYKVVFSYEQFDFCNYWLPKFYFEIYNLNDQGEYVRTTTLTRWLEMGGHAVLISNDTKPFSEKVFYHLHAFLPISTAGEITFPYHDHKNPFPEGEYKVWGQFKDGDKILTFPFEFKYTLPGPIPTDIKCK